MCRAQKSRCLATLLSLAILVIGIVFMTLVAVVPTNEHLCQNQPDLITPCHFCTWDDLNPSQNNTLTPSSTVAVNSSNTSTDTTNTTSTSLKTYLPFGFNVNDFFNETCGFNTSVLHNQTLLPCCCQYPGETTLKAFCPVFMVRLDFHTVFGFVMMFFGAALVSTFIFLEMCILFGFVHDDPNERLIFKNVHRLHID